MIPLIPLPLVPIFGKWRGFFCFQWDILGVFGTVSRKEVGVSPVITWRVKPLMFHTVCCLYFPFSVESQCSFHNIRIQTYISLVGGLEHGFYFSIQLGMSSSPLTNSYFSDGLKPPTSHVVNNRPLHNHI